MTDSAKGNLHRCLKRRELKKHTFTETETDITIDETFTVPKDKIWKELKNSPETAERIKINSPLIGYSPECITAFLILKEAIEKDAPETAEQRARQERDTNTAAELLQDLQRADSIFLLQATGTRKYSTPPPYILSQCLPLESIKRIYDKACSIDEEENTAGTVWYECTEEAEHINNPGTYRIFIKHHHRETDRTRPTIDFF